MPRPNRPLFSSALVPFVLTYLRGHGADVDRLARKYLPRGVVDPAQAPALTTASFRKLMDESADALGDPLFGLHLAQAMPRGSYGLLEFAIRSAPTARAALEQLARFGALINPATRFWLEPGEREVAVHHRLSEDREGVGRHGNLFTVARLLVMGREMIGEHLRPERVWFAHALPKRGSGRDLPAELIGFLGTEQLEFGRTSNGLTFDARDLDRPLAGADLALNAMLREHASRLLGELDPGSLQQRTRKALLALLPKGDAPLALVAKKLNLGERTLQRRLMEEGVVFAELAAEVREQEAKNLLAGRSAPVAEIATKLGYSDAATFGRAFKRWTGHSPGAYRSRAR